MTVESRTVQDVVIESGRRHLPGQLSVPANATGMVAFAHGSGSGRWSPRNQYVASVLLAAGLGTLLLDLLEEEESHDREKVFDIPLLADRFLAAAAWLNAQPAIGQLPLGYFGASTGAGAALVAAARHPEYVAAVVSRGGRPDLASDSLPLVQAPTLLIVGGEDHLVLELNEQALRRLRCHKQLVIVPAATHLFEEKGKLEMVAHLASDWFIRFFKPIQ